MPTTNEPTALVNCPKQSTEFCPWPEDDSYDDDDLWDMEGCEGTDTESYPVSVSG